jgi:hypothetical protein
MLKENSERQHIRDFEERYTVSSPGSPSARAWAASLQHAVAFEYRETRAVTLIDLFTNLHLSRLARRGGVKRISATTYDDIRQALKERLHRVS